MCLAAAGARSGQGGRWGAEGHRAPTFLLTRRCKFNRLMVGSCRECGVANTAACIVMWTPCCACCPLAYVTFTTASWCMPCWIVLGAPCHPLCKCPTPSRLWGGERAWAGGQCPLRFLCCRAPRRLTERLSWTRALHLAGDEPVTSVRPALRQSRVGNLNSKRCSPCAQYRPLAPPPPCPPAVGSGGGPNPFVWAGIVRMSGCR
jgi:hypothetical protein